MAALGLLLLGGVAATGGAQTPAGHAGPQGSTAKLPPAPTEAIGSGDSTARHERARRYLARGDAALAAGMRDTARISWENALYEYPALTDASVELATMLVEDGQGYFAQRTLQRALKYDPQNPKLLHFKAEKQGPGTGDQ
jgi:Tfp pilus assembly protein PilF